MSTVYGAIKAPFMWFFQGILFFLEVGEKYGFIADDRTDRGITEYHIVYPSIWRVSFL